MNETKMKCICGYTDDLVSWHKVGICLIFTVKTLGKDESELYCCPICGNLKFYDAVNNIIN